ncbi:MAG: hypothetical protein U0517_03645 [Candidatus Andersenbacteria bacterium]
MTSVHATKQPVVQLAITILAVIATVNGLLFLYWVQRTAYPTTLSKTGQYSAEQIFNQNDPYYTVRRFLRQHTKVAQQADTIVLVGEQVDPPSRFDLEVYYELYPVLPKKVAVGSTELQAELTQAQPGTAFISETELTLPSRQYTKTIGEGCFIYVRQ